MTYQPEVDFDVRAVAGRRVVLIGFMGAGKTTLARRWADSGGPALVFDSDVEILRRSGCSSIAEAFSLMGEEAFRELERDVIVDRCELPALGLELWSLGGGAVLDADVQRLLFDATVLWLDAPVEVLWKRAAHTDRPLARDEQAFAQLYESRRATYESLATVRVDTSGVEVPSLPGALRGVSDVSWFDARVVVAPGAADRIHEVAVAAGAQVAVVADEAVAATARAAASALEAAGSDVVATTLLPMGEWNKQLGTGERLVRQWSQAGLTRAGVVVAIGGGTLLDVAGFAASVYQRGVRWVTVPTTVTAQVDAGIGGKTGVNLGAVKNAIGTVHFPHLVLVDPELLRTLAADVAADGAVEAIKTALLAGEDVLARVEAALGEHDRGGEAWTAMVAACAAYKDAVVREDPDDTGGVRAQLNLGHTIGHAIEGATSGAVSHGAAVAAGIDVALDLSERIAGLDPAVRERFAQLVATAGVASAPLLTWEEIAPFLKHDKKRTSRGIGWVLLERLGQPLTDVHIELDEIQVAWQRWWDSRPAGDRTTGSAPTRRPRVLVLFGVNLGDLGSRDVGHYGGRTLGELVRDVVEWANEQGMVVDCRQTDSLERFVDALREARHGCDAVIVNPGAWTHYERALHDALEHLPVPKVEVHLSDTRAREEWRRESVIAPVVDHTIVGKGAEGYREALQWLRERLDAEPAVTRRATREG